MQSKKRLCRLVLAGIAMLGACGAASLVEAADAGMHVDQVGYLTGHEKMAMVTDSGDTAFSIVDARTDKVVYTGKLSAAKRDAMSEETLRRADFSDFNTPGQYKIKVGSRESYDFAIGDNVYSVPAVQTWRSYTLTRSGTPIDDKNITGLKVKMGHAQDKQAQVYFTDKLNKKVIGSMFWAAGMMPATMASIRRPAVWRLPSFCWLLRRIRTISLRGSCSFRKASSTIKICPMR